MNDDVRIIKRLVEVSSYKEGAGVPTKIGIFLDTETTGLDYVEDQIIELAMVPFEYDADGNIYKILPAYNEFNDPRTPIPEIVTEITGITDDMVAGASLNLDKIRALIDNASIIIAHNAGFDRLFCEKLLPEFENIAWGCSMRDIDWHKEGVESKQLAFIAYRHGFFFDAHRAITDCMAGIEVLSQTLLKSGILGLAALLKSARKTHVRLWAEGAPFHRKDDLKRRGYSWSAGANGTRKAWYIDVLEQDLEDEIKYLQDDIFSYDVRGLPTRKFNAMVRYSSRVG